VKPVPFASSSVSSRLDSRAKTVTTVPADSCDFSSSGTHMYLNLIDDQFNQARI
jgi:hypothetical protein